jgi:hypothetical protein
MAILLGNLSRNSELDSEWFGVHAFSNRAQPPGRSAPSRLWRSRQKESQCPFGNIEAARWPTTGGCMTLSSALTQRFKGET